MPLRKVMLLLNIATSGVSDNVAPTVVITSDAVEPVSAAFTATFTFSEEVTGFVVGDITVANAALSAFATADNITFTATVTPDWVGDVSLSVAAGVCEDAAGNTNAAGGPLAVTMSAPINTLAPAIAATATIGTTITPTPGTWTPGSPTLTYQWQQYTGGAWADIVGATTANRAPVDANFGLSLRLAETATNGAGSTTAYSNATDLTAEAPAETVGPAELLINGTFAAAAWTGDNPNNWTVTGESGSDPMVTQVAPDGSAGTGAAKFYSSATNLQPRLSQTALSIGTYYQLGFDITAFTAGGISIDDGGAGFASKTGVGSKLHLMRAASTSCLLRASTNAPINVVVDNATAKALTINTQLTAPSANMRLNQFYTLPGTPLPGTQVWGYARISNFSLGNFWKWVLIYTGSQWNITLYRVATFTATSVASALNVGVTNGVGLTLSGDQISLYTTANGGALWTQRDTTKTDNTYQTATGVNVIWTNDVTIGSLVYAVPP